MTDETNSISPNIPWKSLAYIAALVSILVITVWAITWLEVTPAPPQSSSSISSSNSSSNTSTSGNWYFAVSGDSRDCGDLIMPKIAQTIADNKQNAPVEFYWHLGDLRAIYRVDCDMGKMKDASFQCVKGDPSPNQTEAMKNKYLSEAWPDFINSQIKPFEKLGVPFYVGIGNHELIAPKTRDQFRKEFKEWLTKQTIQEQRAADRHREIASKDGDTYFHFIWKDVDIIYLDNANIYDDKNPAHQDPGFSEDQLKWLDLVLKRDEDNPQVKAVIVGMHAALPESVSRNHAMDRNCASFCNGKRAYDRLVLTQSRGKKVYIMASHSHYFEDYIYDTPEQKGHGLRGWIVGTAGAEQYRSEIRYGYLLVEVSSDGTIHASFQRVYSDSSPVVGPPSLTQYCFQENQRVSSTTTEAYKTANDCHCPVH